MTLTLWWVYKVLLRHKLGGVCQLLQGVRKLVGGVCQLLQGVRMTVIYNEIAFLEI